MGIGEFHKELVRLAVNNRLGVAAPRGHAKSTIFSFFYTLYLLLEYPGIEILNVSATGALSEMWVERIRSELEMNTKLRDFYGDQIGKKWTNTEIVLANGSWLQAKGSGKQIRGFRPQVIIGDDLETDEMVLSVEQMRKFTDWFWNTLMQSLRAANTQIIVIGTILHPDSFLSELVHKGRYGWVTRLFAAKNDNVALWPEMYSLERLAEIEKEMGSYGFAQEYMNDPIPDEKRIFRRDWFEYYTEEPKSGDYYILVDPATDTKTGKDDTAIVVVCVDDKENIFVVNYWARRMSPSEIVGLLFELFERYNPIKICIEEVGFQKMLSDEFKTQRRYRKKYPIVEEVKPGGRRKLLRIEALQPRYEAKRIFHKEGMDELETQLLRFPSIKCKDDIIDALAYILDVIRPATRAAEKVNPNCFMAVLEARKKAGQTQQVWGNHKLRLE